MFESSLFRMLIYTPILLLMSNAISLRRDKSIPSFIIILQSLILGIILTFDLHFKVVCILLKSYITIFNLFVFLIASLILTLAAFYLRKIHIVEKESICDFFIRRLYVIRDKFIWFKHVLGFYIMLLFSILISDIDRIYFEILLKKSMLNSISIK